MTAQARQMWLLAVLVTTLTGVVIYQFSPAGPAGGAAAPSNLQGRQAADAGTMAVADLHLERLQAGAGPYIAPRRDPFRYRPKAAPPPPPPPVAPQVFIPPPPPAAPPPRPIPLKYFGFALSTSGVRVALLQDGTGRPSITGVQGDVIEGQYRLLRVEAEEIEVAYLDGTGRRRIPKTGQ